MRPTEVARETLRRAVELQVLETDDVSAAGSLLQDPRELVDQLKLEKFLTDAVEKAFARLIELRPGGSAKNVVTSKGKLADLSGGSATMAPSRGAEPAFDAKRKSAEKDYADAKVLLGDDPNTGTVAGARDAAAPSMPQTWTDEGGQTVAKLSGRPTPAPSVELGDGSSTVAPARGAGEKAKGFADAARPDEGGDALDIAALEPEHRRVIEAAAFCRIALRLKKVTRDQILAAQAEGEAGVEERLLDAGAIDQATAMEIFALRATNRAACGNCFGVLPPNHDATKGCSICGQASTSSSGRHTSATMSDGGGARGIEGFPGQGGLFAGYELIDRIAEGGMGVVFKARQTKLNRIVALKVMRGGSLANKERRRRFRQEAESAAALRHPCIVPVHEIDEVAGYPFYTMEFVEGVTMEAYVAAKKLAPKRVTSIVRGVADAVQHFHLRGIIHRDLKPGNILVGEDEVPKIIDFGIAKKLVPDSDSSTIEGEVLGTPYYMSPEQATGRVTEVDVRTDTYALGAILYELLTGNPPWKGYRQARLITAIQEEDPESIRAKNPAVELDLESIVMKAMSKERERRYQSAADLAADLERYEKNMPVTARPATLGYRLKKYVRRRLPQVIGAGVALVAVAATLGALAADAARKRAEIHELCSRAKDESLDIATRSAAAQQALGKDPSSVEAKDATSLIEAARKTEQERVARIQYEKDEAARLEKKTLEDKLARQEAEKKANELRAQEQARLDAERKARADAEDRARSLLAQAKAKAANAPLDAIPDLQEALVVCPKEKDSAALRLAVENVKIDLELALAKEQVVKNQSGLARFWLGDARRLAASKARESELAAIEDALRKLESGEKELGTLHDLVAKSDWVRARPLLEQLKKLGIDAGRLAADAGAIEKGCAQSAAQLVAEGRTLLAKGDPANGMAKALEALALESGEAEKALLADCERADALDARRKAAESWKRPETQKTALVLLAQAADRVQDPALKTLLAEERAARARLLDDRSLAGLCFVPAVPDLAVKACYVQRTEVTNAEYKQFVDAGGYGMPDLWEGVSADVQATFRDGCPGGTCSHKGPRTWTNGGFGDFGNADRPVRGITFFEARAYAKWLSKKGGTYRLASDREWEVAAGFDPNTQRLSRYPWGDEWTPSALALATDLPRPVASTTGDVSALGLSDMAGNVMEWVERKDADPGTKGAAYAASDAVAKRFALVRNTGTPGATPPPELLQWIGFRLVRVIEEK